MAAYEIAHIREQGQDIIIVPLKNQFHFEPSNKKEAFRQALQRCAANAGLKGTVCLVWNHGGRFHSIAPQEWHPFFKGIDMLHVSTNINRKLTC